MKLKSWKTTLGGIGTILAGIGGAIKLWTAGSFTEAITTAIAAITAGLGLIAARDNAVPSSAIPKAAERDAENKRETEFLQKP